MKRIIALSLALLAASTYGTPALLSPPDTSDTPESSEKIHYQLILPEEKAPEVVKPSEPNPFSKADTHVIKEDGASGEENRVREILSSLPITGYAAAGPNGTDARVMIGPMKLKRGDFVPKVLADQSVRLRVNAISEDQIDLVWEEKKKSTGMPPRIVTLPVRVRPKVRTELPSIPPAYAESSKKSQSRFIYQEASPDTGGPPETRKATAAENSGTPLPTTGTPEVKSDPDHPANLLMNLLFKSVNKTVEAPPPEAK
jgi:hypothetical protein